MKTNSRFILLAILMIAISAGSLYAQVEVIGRDNSSASKSLIVKNSDSDTSLVVLDNGNVGIGTTSPGEKFVIEQDGWGSIEFTGNDVQFSNDDASYIWSMNSSGYLSFGSGGRFEDMTISTSGNVGIGTTNPFDKLDVYGNYGWHAPNNFQMRGEGEFSFDFDDGDGNDYWQIWAPVHNSILSAHNNGNVGIGTTIPGQKLTVAGTIESTSGGIKFPDGTIQTTALTGGVTGTYNFYNDGTSGNVTSITITGGIITNVTVEP